MAFGWPVDVVLFLCFRPVDTRLAFSPPFLNESVVKPKGKGEHGSPILSTLGCKGNHRKQTHTPGCILSRNTQASSARRPETNRNKPHPTPNWWIGGLEMLREIYPLQSRGSNPQAAEAEQGAMIFGSLWLASHASVWLAFPSISCTKCLT